MKQEAEIKKIFINNAIYMIATSGFEGATVRKIVHRSRALSGLKVSERYIYHIFGSKEKLYGAAFEQLDNELYVAFMQGIEAIRGFKHSFKERMYNFFLMAWGFVLDNEERCKCYVRYYYSPYFKGDVLEAHDRLFMGVVIQLKTLFKEEADVVAILHSVFTTFLNFAICVFNGELADSAENRPHVFNVLYLMMSDYFKRML